MRKSCKQGKEWTKNTRANKRSEEECKTGVASKRTNLKWERMKMQRRNSGIHGER